MGLRIGPSRSSLRKASNRAKRRETRRLEELEREEQEAAEFAKTEGEGISEAALIDLSLDEDDSFLSEGVVDDDDEDELLGLFL